MLASLGDKQCIECQAYGLWYSMLSSFTGRMGGLNVSTLAKRLRVFPPSNARDLFLQRSSPMRQDIPPTLALNEA
eukprot:9680188-Ditylum_brightwellii.AAC.1